MKPLIDIIDTTNEPNILQTMEFHNTNPLTLNQMNIIELTPINLGNDNCDIVNAFIYRTSDLREYKLVINYPVSPRITDEFSNDEIEYLWSVQYPKWNDLLFPTY